jgi:hypothetical protein
MRTHLLMRLTAAALAAMAMASCGGDSDTPAPVEPAPPATEPTPAPVQPAPTPVQPAPPSGQTTVNAYLQTLPSWAQFSPERPDQQPTPNPQTAPVPSSERIDSAAGSTQYNCVTRKMTMADTPEKIVMFSPDRELLWPGALLQGASHRDPLGSLRGLPIRERAPIRLSIPSLASATNFRTVEAPDMAGVNRAIGEMIGAASGQLATPSSIQFTLRDYTSDESFALQAGMSGKYMGFRASASASVANRANERTVMVHFVEKMFEVVVEPPQTPAALFSADFTKQRLDEQIALGRIGPSNIPVYVSNVVYGRMMAFTFTSTASVSDIKAALNAAYSGFGASISADVKAAYKKTISEGRISITSVGGPSVATVAMIASGEWQDYFRQTASLSTAYPISYTFRNLGDGSIAKVTETSEYEIKECAPAGGTAFVLDSFEYPATDQTVWQPAVMGVTQAPITVAWKDPATSQSIFYGYEAVKHANASLQEDWVFNVGYLEAPARFTGNKASFYRGELSFWYKPDATLYSQQAGTTLHCWRHYYFLFLWELRCVELPVAVPAEMALSADNKVYVYDDQTTADQIVLRGGGDAASGSLLTITYNPKNAQRQMSQGWQKLTLSLTNHDNAGQPICTPADPWGCWMVEDRMATEDEIKLVLATLHSMRLRASYPVYGKGCKVTIPAGQGCPTASVVDVPLGFVGGYFDEIKITKPSLN